MVYITQLKYIKEGLEKVFNPFEDIAISILPKYNGKLLLRLRSSYREANSSNIEIPKEAHLIQFDSNADF